MTRRRFENITIAITSLATGESVQYDIMDKYDYDEAVENFNENHNKHDGDYEVQLLDVDYKGRLDNNKLEDFLQLCEDFRSEQPQDIVYLLMSNSYDEVEEILRKGIFFVIIEEDNKWKAFRDYVENYDVVHIPEHLRDWIDYEEMLFDYECGGLFIERVDYRTYLIIH